MIFVIGHLADALFRYPRYNFFNYKVIFDFALEKIARPAYIKRDLMSKKNRNRKQKKKNFPWPLVILGGLLLIVAAFFFANRDGGNGGGTPAITVDQQKIDYGYVKFGNNKTFAIKVTNTGDGTLRFKDKPYVEVV